MVEDDNRETFSLERRGPVRFGPVKGYDPTWCRRTDTKVRDHYLASGIIPGREEVGHAHVVGVSMLLRHGVVVDLNRAPHKFRVVPVDSVVDNPHQLLNAFGKGAHEWALSAVGGTYACSSSVDALPGLNGPRGLAEELQDDLVVTLLEVPSIRKLGDGRRPLRACMSFLILGGPFGPRFSGETSPPAGGASCASSRGRSTGSGHSGLRQDPFKDLLVFVYHALDL